MGVVVVVVAGGAVGVAGVVVVVVVVPGVPGVSAVPAAGSTGVVSGAGVAAGDGVDCNIGASLENISVSTSQEPSRFTHVTTDLPFSLVDEAPEELLNS